MRKALLCVAGALLVFSTAVYAEDSSKTATKQEEKATSKTKEKGKKGTEASAAQAILAGESTTKGSGAHFGGIITFEQSLGLGTFVADEYARNPYYGWSFYFRPRYYINRKMYVELRWGFDVELTSSYTSASSGAISNKKHQFMPSDVYLMYRYNSLLKEKHTGISFSPYVVLNFPASYFSRHQGLYLGSTFGFHLSDAVAKGKLFLDYRFSFKKNFHKYTESLLSKSESYPIALARLGGNEDLGEYIASGTDNTSFTFSNSFMISWSMTDKWSLTLLLGINNSFGYVSYPNDEFKAKAAKSGRPRSDTTQGVIDLTYQPWRHYGFSIGISSYQPAKTANNKSIRFPFFDFISEANNFTNFYFDVFAVF